ncbi:Iron-sulfur cluster regulator IscR [Coxiella-like endosymbiont]|uniref:SUF system Fe-S cluster assembly regulator n=1 Tax=Coxiella endosymbiont of Rhipicephalus microplus TaxID=1656186 RepID=UPI000C7F8B8D|nr:SUF system Fe-S cluster assembly regulator [Coxiella endosymbiont of Rhipicephalus microplus]PMB54730.1 Iron-sulfur cluster regulator IscR [Coxiella-like endosymbiont]
MLKISRLADYATIIMTILASKQERFSAAQIARAIPLSMATVSKVLKLLNESKLVNSERGVNGGYQLARSPERISIADIITAIDGKPAMTECSRAENRCEHDTVCRLRNNWQLINELVFEVLDSLNLVEIKKPLIKRRISTFQCDHFQCSDVPRECGHGTPLLTVRI